MLKSDRTEMNSLALNSGLLHELTKEESFQLKRVLLSIFDDLADFCDKNGLKIMLLGGSALGAVRHKGFIPWDDDLDAGMHRSDYNKLIQLVKNGALSDKYDFTFPDKDKDTKNLFFKMYLKNTKCVELYDDNEIFPNGIFIDVFPIENAPNNRFLQKIKGLIADAISYTSVSVLYHQYRSSTMENYMSSSPKSKRRFKTRLLLGKLASVFMKHQKWAFYFDQFVSNTKDSKFLCIPTGRKHYCGEIIEVNTIFPLKQLPFEDRIYNVPNDVNKYLQNLYGDYMTLPPLEKRERHFVIKLEF